MWLDFYLIHSCNISHTRIIKSRDYVDGLNDCLRRINYNCAGNNNNGRNCRDLSNFQHQNLCSDKCTL